MTKLMLGNVEPVMVASLFYLGSGTGMMLLVVFSLLKERGSVRSEAPLTRGDIPYLLGMSLFGGVLAPVTLTYSMTITPAATGALLLNFESVATACLAYLVFKEAVGRRIWTAMLLIASSCILLSFDPGAELGISIGAAGILLSCIFWACDNNISRAVSGKDPLSAIMVKGLAAGIFTFFIALAIGEHIPEISMIPLYLVVGFFSFGGLASVFFLLALRSLGTARTGLFLALSPFFGVFFSLVLFREMPQTLFIPAFLVMIIGTWLLVTEQHAHMHHHQPIVHNHRHRHDDLHHDHQHSDKMPPVSPTGNHAHLHAHEEQWHDHPHKPDIHHLHDHK